MVDLPRFPDGWQTALVVAAHPDDIEWGLSAAVAAWTAQGREVEYLLVTSGEAGIAGLQPAEAGPLREEEQRRAAQAVGVKEVWFAGFADGRVEEGLELRRAIAAQIRRSTPEVVVAMNHGERWGDSPGAPWNFADHRAVGRATIDAVYDAANEWLFTELESDGVRPWSGTRHVAIAPASSPTHQVPVLADHVEQSVRSLAAHRRYLEALQPGDLDAYVRGVVERATTREDGQRAVAFELLSGPGGN